MSPAPSTRRVVCFLPGDYRSGPNQLARPNVDVFVAALTGALRTLGREPYLIDRFLTTPADAIDALSGIDDPMIGLYAHWVYGPHTTDGVVGTDTPLLLASNFDGTWPGLVGLLNTGACLTSLGRAHSRLWSDAEDLTTDKWFMDALDTWLETGATRARCWVRAPAARSDLVTARGYRARRHAGEAAARGHARRHVHGHDQRLLRTTTPRARRVLGAQDRPGVVDRAGQDRRSEPRRRRAGLRARSWRRIPLRRRLHRGRDTQAAARLLRRARPAGRIPRRLPRLAVPARADPLAAAVRLRRGLVELRVPAGDERHDDRLRHGSRPGQRAARWSC